MDDIFPTRICLLNMPYYVSAWYAIRSPDPLVTPGWEPDSSLFPLCLSSWPAPEDENNVNPLIYLHLILLFVEKDMEKM